MNENFLHIGYHKTGTSWMQKFLFPEIFGKNFLGKPFKDYNENNWSFLELMGKEGGKAASNEWIMKQETSIDNLSSILKDKLTNTKIIISIRRQKELLLSRFLHKPIERFKIWDVDLESCLFKPSKLTKSRKYVSIPLYWYYNFAETYRLFSEKFGGENVHFIVYENLFQQPCDEIERLLCFLNKDIGNSKKKYIEKNTNQTINTKKNHLKSPTSQRWDKEGEEYKQDVLLMIQDAYEKSNQQMSGLINFDLSKYGYCK